MGGRYVARRKPLKMDWYDDSPPPIISLTVYETEDTPRETGVLDADGNELVWLSDREPIGFIRFKDD